MSVLAFDIGASNGRAVMGFLDGDILTIKETHRFDNIPVKVGKRLYWDILRLIFEVKTGILKSRLEGHSDIQGIGMDTWGVDIGLLGRNEELLGNPYHYRDHQFDGKMEEVHSFIPREEIYEHTGIQFLPFNTIYQLYTMNQAKSVFLEQTETLLMIPDLIRYFLTGEKNIEFTIASTSQLLNPTTRNWDQNLLGKLGLPESIFADIVEPGTLVGELSQQMCDELGVPPIPVIAVGEHDTASAVAAVPTENEEFAFLSCGTWSLLGTEVNEPIINEQALQWNFTNEGGVYDTFRLLKNIMGLWIIQECKRTWEKEGKVYTYEEMTQLAMHAKPFQAFIDPDHVMFMNPSHMPKQIQTYCRDTNQHVPENESEMIRCVLESLAMRYRVVFEQTEELIAKKFSNLHMFGGGIKNELLCQFTSNALDRPVLAGPVEATVLGNIIVQYITLGKIKNLKEARSIIRESFPIKTYEPENVESWYEAFVKYQQVTIKQ